ncbi:MAG: hypothetical protein CVV12_01810 [Gammaproteobacteria bacterium HGW-Gammaproteobacteria-2]|jgi:hypothetical protein|nr:MAG: hypothetical protein CVV12_01810 [Gammaproteobacteria bacterium HGW-Gammaproteobacteria-2]
MAIAPLLATLSFHATATCTNPTLTAQPGSSTLTATQNFGIYDWDESAQAWVLDQAGYAAFAETETLQAGDISIPASVFSGGGGGTGGGGGGTQVNLQAGEIPTDTHQGSSKTGTTSLCGDPPVMPATIVTGFRPSGGVGFLRLSVFRIGGGGRSGIGRPTPSIRSASDDISCSSEPVLRLANARASLTLGLGPNAAFARPTFTVIYRNGQRETWQIFNAFSSVGARPVGSCG